MAENVSPPRDPGEREGERNGYLVISEEGTGRGVEERDDGVGIAHTATVSGRLKGKPHSVSRN